MSITAVEPPSDMTRVILADVRRFNRRDSMGNVFVTWTAGISIFVIGQVTEWLNAYRGIGTIGQVCIAVVFLAYLVVKTFKWATEFHYKIALKPLRNTDKNILAMTEMLAAKLGIDPTGRLREDMRNSLRQYKPESPPEGYNFDKQADQ